MDLFLLSQNCINPSFPLSELLKFSPILKDTCFTQSCLPICKCIVSPCKY